jgi:probable HAF family extracellular repeat protein
MKSIKKLMVAAAFCVSLTTLGFGQQVFTIVKVPNSVPDTLTAVNDSGQVLVNTTTSTSNTVSQWTLQGGSVPLQLDGQGSVGVAMNSAGDIVGAGTEGAANNVQAFIWRPSSGQQWLGTLGNYPSSANAVNAAGAVVGASHNAAQQTHAFLWTEASGMQDLTPNITSPLGSIATGINDSNEVVGYYYPDGSTEVEGFTWTQAGGLQNLGPAGTLALAISDSGTVVGQSPNAAGRKHAFSWTQSGGLVDLGTLGGDASTALAINKKGWIVGTSLTGATNGDIIHGFLWTPGGGMQDFTTVANFSQGQQVYSVALNDYGDIAVATQSRVVMLAPRITTAVTSSENPSVVGQAVTFTVTLSSVAGPPPDGETIEVSANSTVYGTGTLKNGVAQVTLSGFKAGNRPITVTYSGDAYFLSFKTVTITQVVNP